MVVEHNRHQALQRLTNISDSILRPETLISHNMPSFAVIAGVGAGTGRSVALKFAKAYPVALLARTPANYESIVEEINASGGKAIGISTDVSDSASVKAAFKQIESELGGTCSAAVFNASGGFVRKPFLETEEKAFVTGMSVSA